MGAAVLAGRAAIRSLGAKRLSSPSMVGWVGGGAVVAAIGSTVGSVLRGRNARRMGLRTDSASA
jgi:hypothetical protein